MSSEEAIPKRTDFKYKIGKIKQTPPVLKDDRTGMEYIELKLRQTEHVYGCTVFQGHYKEEKKLGQGTFGEVYRGVHLETKRQVAMKRTIVKAEKDLFPITAQREITILRKLNHKNVIKLIEMVYDYPLTNTDGSTSGSAVPNASPSKSFYMILPYMVADMAGILHNPRIKLELGAIKNILLQIFEGVNYIHCQKYMHRDIKTANLLVDHKGVLKIADFGLARGYYGAPPNLKYPGGAGVEAKYTSVVVTRWYRAPELVLGDKFYTTAVDMWGVGCVFGEIFEKKPILQGQTDIDQGHVIFKLLGTPDEEQWPLARYLPGAELTRTSYAGNLRDRFGPHLSPTGLDLLTKLLSLDPYKRLTAMAAKHHPFFTEEPLPETVLQLPCEECHEADIKRYKQEQNKSLSQQPPPAPQGHVAETSMSTTPQLPKGPKGSNHYRGGLKQGAASRDFNETKRGGARNGIVTNQPSDSNSRDEAGVSELPRVSRYSGASQTNSHGISHRSESRFNNAPRSRFSGSGSADAYQRGAVSKSGLHKSYADPEKNGHPFSYDTSAVGQDRAPAFPKGSRYGGSSGLPRDPRLYVGGQVGPAADKRNANETPLGRSDKHKSFLPQESINGQARGPDQSSRRLFRQDNKADQAQPRQTYKSAKEDIADLY
ncbi:LADA_0A00628g1_1 [Lachancea dasiensis]|uniref:Serine/threonine-protein kinase BUR1 n=1 Tax=Lachancea dasiensis TaxID=1072105 RepID=A0A1G4ILP3_9SACH|nr:LADA_0A00628g1_1 [Lachancea dasiensis]